MSPDPTEIRLQLTAGFVRRVRQAALAVAMREIGAPCGRSVRRPDPPRITEDQTET